MFSIFDIYDVSCRVLVMYSISLGNIPPKLAGNYFFIMTIFIMNEYHE